MFKSSTIFRLLLLCAVVALSGCSWFSNSDDGIQAAKILAPLEVPPDLIRPVADPRLARPELPVASPNNADQAVDCRCGEPPRIGERVLPQNQDVQRMRDGQRRWLQVSVEPEQVWPLVRKFVEMRGYRVSRDEPAIGLLETGWENRFGDDSDDGKGGTDENGKANWREMLRIRIEPAERLGSSEIYLSQRNGERVITDEGEPVWQLRKSDEDRAIEMLNRLAQYLVAEDVKDAVPLDALVRKLGIDDNGHSVLFVEAPFDKVWRRTGVALEGLGFIIEDNDRANRIYHVFNELPSNRLKEDIEYGRPEDATVREEYWVHVNESGADSVISMHNKIGKAADSTYARHVLTLLEGQL
jgi:outer membrane protein assembly factor BamC